MTKARDVLSKVYGQYCPIAKSLDLVGDRWTLLIVRDLLRGKQRFKDLQESLTGIAPNLLTDRLRKLEASGLVVRTKFKQIPPRVDYKLTAKGQGLEAVLRSLARFGMINVMDPPRANEYIDPELIFQAMPAVFIPEKAEGVSAVFQIDVKGKQGGTWFVAIADGDCSVSRATEVKPKVVISTDMKTWSEIATGSLPPAEAETLGALTVTGSRKLADKFGTFFSRRDDDARTESVRA